MEWVLVPGQIFSGCCLNVFLLESLLAAPSDTGVDYGPVVTACQYLLTSAISVVPLLDYSEGLWRRGFLQEPRLPRRKLAVVVLMYFAVSVLNNAAWKYDLSVPVHTMFRSSGTVVLLAVGYLFGGKLYSKGQVVSCIVMTTGILMVVAQKHAGPATKDAETGKGIVGAHLYFWGVFMLFVSSIILAFMGLYTENMFRRHGRHWKESLFYLHFYGLPLFLIYSRTIRDGCVAIWSSLPTYTVVPGLSWQILQQSLLLLVNAVTQMICVRGVNRLTSFASALTITVILSLRKFANLVISSIVFGNTFNWQSITGSILLVLGSIQYAIYSIKEKNKKKDMLD